MVSTRVAFKMKEDFVKTSAGWEIMEELFRGYWGFHFWVFFSINHRAISIFVNNSTIIRWTNHICLRNVETNYLNAFESTAFWGQIHTSSDSKVTIYQLSTLWILSIRSKKYWCFSMVYENCGLGKHTFLFTSDNDFLRRIWNHDGLNSWCI